MNSTGLKRKGDGPDEDSSDEKESKRTRHEDSNDLSDTVSSKENDQSTHKRVEIPFEHNDTNTSLQHEMQDKKEKNDKDDSEEEDNESKHSVKTDSTESEVSKESTIYSRSESSDSSVNEITVSESVLVSKSEEDIDNENRSNTEVEQETQKDEFVYRLLDFYESYSDGLRPKAICSYTSLQQHVEDGSKGVRSRYISCCKTMSALRRLGGITNKSHRERSVVRINISKLDRDNVKVIDLTDEDIRRQHISPSSLAWGYAENFDEVILAPTSHVPKECVEKIGKIHRQSFVKDENIELD